MDKELELLSGQYYRQVDLLLATCEEVKYRTGSTMDNLILMLKGVKKSLDLEPQTHEYNENMRMIDYMNREFIDNHDDWSLTLRDWQRTYSRYHDIMDEIEEVVGTIDYVDEHTDEDGNFEYMDRGE